ncbi:MAG: RsmE family RNA methyltransferase [Planctomycetota bacterium]
MKQARFYCESIRQGLVRLTPDQAHHLVNVLRLTVGGHVELFDGKGTLARAVITDINRKAVTLQAEVPCREPARTTSRIIIAASIAKGQRFDWLLTKCTELGVDHIAAVIFERTVKLAKGASAIQRYDKLAIAAARQCGRIFLPKITGPADLARTLGHLKNDYPDARLIFGSLDRQAESAVELARDGKDTIAFVGPEGGFTQEEINMLKTAGASEAHLTDTTLRVETAAVAFAAILCASRCRKVGKRKSPR